VAIREGQRYKGKSTIDKISLDNRTEALLRQLKELDSRYNSVRPPFGDEERYRREHGRLEEQFQAVRDEYALIDRELVLRVPSSAQIPEEYRPAVAQARTMIQSGKLAGAMPFRMLAINLEILQKMTRSNLAEK
jgi:hypothetical protein